MGHGCNTTSASKWSNGWKALESTRYVYKKPKIDVTFKTVTQDLMVFSTPPSLYILSGTPAKCKPDMQVNNLNVPCLILIASELPVYLLVLFQK